MHHRMALLRSLTDMRDHLNHLASDCSENDSEVSELLFALAASVGETTERIRAMESPSLEGKPIPLVDAK